MAITIDGKQYDETKLDDKHKNAIVQVSKAQARLRDLVSQSENEQIIIKHQIKLLKHQMHFDPKQLLLQSK